MTIANSDIAAVFGEIAKLLDLQGSNALRARAYRNAARTLARMEASVAAMLERGERLDALPGIGPTLADRIAEIVRTGRCGRLEGLRQEVPAGLLQLLDVPGLGPRRVGQLHAALGIRSLDELRSAAEQGRIHGVHGFGLRAERLILEAARSLLKKDRRWELADADPVAQALCADLAGVPGVAQSVAAGSLRRRRDTVGDVDLLVAASDARAVIDRFVGRDGVQQVLANGTTRASVVLDSGLQVDLRVVAAGSAGAALLYLTGSKAHNIALRSMARHAGLKLNEYGLYRNGERIAGDTEAAVYQALGLPFIEPELREDRGEIEAARQGRLPRLVQLGDLCGDLHSHTRDSDGTEGLQAMAEAARSRGLRYLAITDHSSHAATARGLDAAGLARQMDRIDEINDGLQGIVLLKGVEAEILEDGRLDLPDAVLGRLDLVVGAIHHGFGLSRERQTARILRAMDGPHFSILGHPSGRLIGERPPCDADWSRILRQARERGCFLELNAYPSRLDLTDLGCRAAKEQTVMISIASDAHAARDFDDLRYGIGQARRGWLEPADVLNTRTLQQLRPLLAATMGRSVAASTVG